MGEFLKAAFSALPSVASSPYALGGFVVACIVWLIIALKVKRHRQLLSHLKELRPKDRLQALRDEMGTVPLKEGLTPEQYLKSNIIRYYFYAFITLCLLAAVIFAVLVFFTNYGTVSSYIDERPVLSLVEQTSGVPTLLEDQSLIYTLNFEFKNIGKKPMIGLGAEVVWWTKTQPINVEQTQHYPSMANIIRPDDKTNLPRVFRVPMNMLGEEMYIYILATYNDANNREKAFCDEFWIKWKTGNDKAYHMYQAEVLQLLPNIKTVYREEREKCKLT